MGLGIDGGMQVYLDVSRLPKEKTDKIQSILDIYYKFTGDDPRHVPMKIFPAMHYTMGGAWVDWPAADDPDRWERYRQMTNLPGCFSIGEADYQYHGANRLGANALLACIFSGLVAGQEVPRYIDNLTTSHEEITSSFFDKAITGEEALKKDLLSREGNENAYLLYDELGDWMTRHATVKRDNFSLQLTLDKIKEIKERYQHISLSDRTPFANQTYAFANQLAPMLELAMVITKGALLRNESRGAHYKQEFPYRDDECWLKTTVAVHHPGKEEPEISYEEVDLRHMAPSLRKYTEEEKMTCELKNVPNNLLLPV